MIKGRREGKELEKRERNEGTERGRTVFMIQKKERKRIQGK